jgi:hypothetical protein
MGGYIVNKPKAKQPAKYVWLSILFAIAFSAVLASCADRVRENCETTKANGLLERRCP